MTGRTVIFAGGGTGGHLFPGLAIAEEIAQRESDCRFLFLCSSRAIDAEILRAADQCFMPMPARPFGARPKTLTRFLGAWGPSVRAARRAIRQEREEGRDVLMAAMGGFVAPPCAQAARAERVPLTMFNLDATPGLANQWMARRADQILTTYTIPAWPKATRIPPIVRQAALASADAPSCRAAFGLDANRMTLAVMGGSQGAETINDAMMELARTDPECLRSWQVIHQCGAGRESELVSAYEDTGVRAVVRPFIANVGEVWGAADLALGRAGAGTVAEAWANETPAIFLPYPFHRDAHQAANAMPLVDRGGAVIIRDAIEPSVNAPSIGDALRRCADRQALETMRAGLRSLGPADGARVAAERLLAERPKTH